MELNYDSATESFKKWDVKLPKEQGYINLYAFWKAYQSGKIAAEDRGFYISEIDAVMPTKHTPFFGMTPKEVFIMLEMNKYLIESEEINRDGADAEEIDSDDIEEEHNGVDDDKSNDDNISIESDSFSLDISPTALVVVAVVVYLVLYKK